MISLDPLLHMLMDDVQKLVIVGLRVSLLQDAPHQFVKGWPEGCPHQQWQVYAIGFGVSSPQLIHHHIHTNVMSTLILQQ